MRVGTGRFHFYDQAQRNPGRGGIHHFDVARDDARMKAHGVPFKKDVVDLGSWEYIMAPGPDDVLIEPFEVNKAAFPPE